MWPYGSFPVWMIKGSAPLIGCCAGTVLIFLVKMQHTSIQSSIKYGNMSAYVHASHTVFLANFGKH